MASCRRKASCVRKRRSSPTSSPTASAAITPRGCEAMTNGILAHFGIQPSGEHIVRSAIDGAEIGPVAVISAFNFPVAVWSWNAALALVCGDSVLWKPSEKTPLTALATQALFERAAKKFGDGPANLSQVILGLREAGEALAKDRRI